MDFNVDEVDISMENYEELFGMSLNEGIDDFFGTKEMPAADSSCQGANAIEVVVILNSVCPVIIYLT